MSRPLLRRHRGGRHEVRLRRGARRATTSWRKPASPTTSAERDAATPSQEFFDAVAAELGALSTRSASRRSGPWISSAVADVRSNSRARRKRAGPARTSSRRSRGASAAPCAIDTDVNAAALAETTARGRRAAARRSVYVTVGTGIGGGAVVDGRTLQGLAASRDGAHPRRAPRARHRVRGRLSVSRRLSRGSRQRLRRSSRATARRSIACRADHEAFAVVGHYLGQLAANVLLMLSPERVDLRRRRDEQRARCCARCAPTAARLLNGYAGFGTDATSFERSSSRRASASGPVSSARSHWQTSRRSGARDVSGRDGAELARASLPRSTSIRWLGEA